MTAQINPWHNAFQKFIADIEDTLEAPLDPSEVARLETAYVHGLIVAHKTMEDCESEEEATKSVHAYIEYVDDVTVRTMGRRN